MTDPIIKRVLAIDPFAKGVGFAVLEDADKLIDWGLKSTGRADNGKSLRVIEALIGRFQPDVLALEDWGPSGARRGVRVSLLLDRIVSEQSRRLRVQIITRRQLRAIGPPAEARTKEVRARFLAMRFPELEPVPRARGKWRPEAERANLFDAVALALACFAPQTTMADPADQTPT